LRVADSFDFELRKRDIYALYYPAENAICFAETSANSARVIAERYPVVTGSDSTASPPFDVWQTVTIVKAALWEELSKTGLSRNVLGTKNGIGKTIEHLRKADLRTDWSLFARLTEDYGCVQCGNSQGTELFSKCDPPSKDDQRDHYVTTLRHAGFACDKELIAFLYAKMRFRNKSPQIPPETIETIPPFLSEGSVNISKAGCPNTFGVCSTATGLMSGDVFTISRNPPH
jgi:hypothetical protein